MTRSSKRPTRLDPSHDAEKGITVRILYYDEVLADCTRAAGRLGYVLPRSSWRMHLVDCSTAALTCDIGRLNVNERVRYPDIYHEFN